MTTLHEETFAEETFADTDHQTFAGGHSPVGAEDEVDAAEATDSDHLTNHKVGHQNIQY